jgi:hypothetical protein
VDAVRSELVVWGSLWPVSPDDRIGFVIAAEGQGSTVRFAWVTPAPPDDRGVNIVRHRLNQLIGGDLRSWVDTQRATLSP